MATRYVIINVMMSVSYFMGKYLDSICIGISDNIELAAIAFDKTSILWIKPD